MIELMSFEINFVMYLDLVKFGLNVCDKMKGHRGDRDAPISASRRNVPYYIDLFVSFQCVIKGRSDGSGAKAAEFDAGTVWNSSVPINRGDNVIVTAGCDVYIPAGTDVDLILVDLESPAVNGAARVVADLVADLIT